MNPSALSALYLSLLATLAGAAVAALPAYLWLARRARPAWAPVRADAVQVRKGSYRDTTVHPLAVGRVPGAVGLGAYVTAALLGVALWELGRTVWYGHAARWFLGPDTPTVAALAALLALPCATLIVAVSAALAARALLRRQLDAPRRARAVGSTLFALAVARVALALATAALAHAGRAHIAARGLHDGALLACAAWALVRAARTALREAAVVDATPAESEPALAAAP
jgi:hypothetical protein